MPGRHASAAIPLISRDEQGRRIGKLSRLEHDLLKEMHPQVNEIKEGMEEMIAVVKENTGHNPPPASKKMGH